MQETSTSLAPLNVIITVTGGAGKERDAAPLKGKTFVLVLKVGLQLTCPPELCLPCLPRASVVLGSLLARKQVSGVADSPTRQGEGCV